MTEQLTLDIPTAVAETQPPVGCIPLVRRAVPREYEGRAIEEAIRYDVVFGLTGGDLKRLRYCATLWPEWIAETRCRIRRELLGEDYPANTPAQGLRPREETRG